MHWSMTSSGCQQCNVWPQLMSRWVSSSSVCNKQTQFSCLIIIPIEITAGHWPYHAFVKCRVYVSESCVQQYNNEALYCCIYINLNEKLNF